MEKLLGLEELTAVQKTELEVKIQVNKLKNSPHAGQKINRKEGAIRRKISDLESEISTYKTNMEFFASSKTADALKNDLEKKIQKAEAEIDELKKQLEVFKKL